MKRGTLRKWASALVIVGAIAAWCAVGRSRSFAAVVGAPLPATAADVQTHAISGFDGGEYYASARMTEPEFAKLMADLRLVRGAAMAAGYPVAAGVGNHGLSWWPEAGTPDEGVFFAVRPDKTHDSFIAAWYAGGRLYLRRSFW